jgi:hypothetical protein
MKHNLFYEHKYNPYLINRIRITATEGVLINFRIVLRFFKADKQEGNRLAQVTFYNPLVFNGL